jgi:hypothetical protein
MRLKIADHGCPFVRGRDLSLRQLFAELETVLRTRTGQVLGDRDDQAR